MKKLLFFFFMAATVLATEPEELELYPPHQNALGSLLFAWTRYVVGVADSYADPSGYSLGFLVPVNLPVIQSHIKIKGSYFNVQGESFNGMAALVNEILVGKIVYEEDYLFVLPQLGFGARSESRLKQTEDDYFNVKLFVDASFWFDYHLETFSTGLMFNFEHDLPSSEVGFVSDNRFTISFVLSK